MLEEINKRLNDLKQKAQEFSQSVQQIEWKHESKISEIKTLENKIEKLKQEEGEHLKRASFVVQEASERAASVTREAKLLMEQANNERAQAKLDREEAVKLRLQAQSLMDQAIDKQRNADREWHILKEREKKIKEAVGL